MKEIRFEDWEGVLAQSQLPERQKGSWTITLRWYLSFCRRGRAGVTVQSARDFVAWAQEQKQAQAWQVAGWKEALNWFFREAKNHVSGVRCGVSGKTRHSATPLPGPLPVSVQRGEGAGGVKPPAGHRTSTGLRFAPFRQDIEHPASNEGTTPASHLTPDTPHLTRSKPAPAWKTAFLTVVRRRGYSYRTEQSYLVWVQRFARFCRSDDLQTRGTEDIKVFLDELARDERLSASSQRQALNAVVFLLREVYGKELGDFSDYRRAKVRTHAPEWLAPDEVKVLLEQGKGGHHFRNAGSPPSPGFGEPRETGAPGPGGRQWPMADGGWPRKKLRTLNLEL